jgi:hypothetical protein
MVEVRNPRFEAKSHGHVIDALNGIVGERLLRGWREIENAKPPMTEPNSALRKDPFGVGTPCSHRVVHTREAGDRNEALTPYLTTDTAHLLSSELLAPYLPLPAPAITA